MTPSQPSRKSRSAVLLGLADRAQRLGAIIDQALNADEDESAKAWCDELQTIATALRAEADDA